ncbi:hypothetical protein EEL31_09290 [Brevibacillus laterosporus]|nr:hypothetical protein [Brevibacillus laterosporus]TPG68698.1 hypothetical protein EEL31_09290 [Brevibacillus laterosporus]
MATRQMQTLTQRGNHEVGNLNAIKVRTLANGAIVEGGDIDNFTLVELGFNAEGERTCKQLSNVEIESYLIATPEDRYLGEELIDFFNAEGERARIVYFYKGFHFDTSAFKFNSGVTEVKVEQVAHFDPATKKYILSLASSPHADYTKSRTKFVVVNNEDNLEYTCGKPLVRLEIKEF